MVSIRPSEFVEGGGAVPVDRNLLWKECRFSLFEYTRKTGEVVATTTALRVTFGDDDGAEFIQHYSAGDPERFVPSADGKTLVAAGDAQALSKSSNFYILMNALVSAGFPENKIGEDVSVLDGLYAHHIGMPEPKRSGLVRTPTEGQEARVRVISVPDAIIKLPWEKGKGGSAAAVVAEEAGEDATADALAIVTQLVASGEPVNRQKVATAAIRGKKKAVAAMVFTDAFQAALAGGGYLLDGENITAAE